MSTSTSTSDPPRSQTNGQRTTGRKQPTAAEREARKAKSAATRAANAAAAKQAAIRAAALPPSPEPVLANQRIGPAAHSPLSAGPGTPVVKSLPIAVITTTATLYAREAELLQERAIIDGRIAEVRKMIAMGFPATRTPPAKAATRKKTKAKTAGRKQPLAKAA